MKAIKLLIIFLLFATVAKAQGVPSPVACQQFFTPSGVPLAGGFLYSFQSGTTNPLPTFADAGLTIANANPIILSAGGFAVSTTGSCGIFLNPSLTYKFVLQNASSTQQWVVDGITNNNLSTLLNTANVWTQLQTFNGGISISTLTAQNINNVCMADSQSGSDMGSKISACISTLNAVGGGIIDARGFRGSQTWSANVFSGLANPITLLLGVVTISLNVTQIIPADSVRIIGSGNAATIFSVNFASGDVFTIAANAFNFEFAHARFVNGVTRTSGYDFNPATPNINGSVHDVVFVDQYGWFKFAGSASGAVSGWVIDKIWNTGTSSSIHVGTQIYTGTTDGVIGVSGIYFSNMQETGGDLNVHDAPQVVIDSGSDTMKFNTVDLGYSAANTSTQPVWAFTNTQPGLFAPRWIRIARVSPEAPLATCINITAGTNLVFESIYVEGCNTGITISGGNAISITPGSIIANNKHGGLYVTAALPSLQLNVTGTTFSGNSNVANTDDDVQITGGTALFTFSDNQFGTQPGINGAGNNSRWGINLLAGASTNIKILGNTFNPFGLGTGCINDQVTVGAFEIIEDPCVSANNETLYLSGAVAANLRFKVSGAHPNWEISCQQNSSNSCEVTPSTANNGSTFNVPAVVISATTLGVVGTITNTAATATMGQILKTGSGGGNYTGTNTAYVSVDTTNLCLSAITVPTGWKLKVEASGVLESVTAAVAQSIALADAGTTCAGGGITALNGTERTITPPAAGIFDEGFQTQYVFTGDGAAHSLSLIAKTSNAADAWGVQNTSATVAPSIIYTLMPSN
jgi:hypothetical protein